MFIGEISALTAATLWSFGSFLFTEASLRIGTFQLNVDRMTLASLLLIVTLGIFGIQFNITLDQIILLSISGFIGLVIGDTALFRAFKEIGPRVALVLYSINPAIAAILAFLFLNEKLAWLSILGIFITMSGTAMVVLDSHTSSKSDSKFKVTRLGIILGVIAALGQAVGLIIAKQALALGEIHSLIATFVRITAAVIIIMPISILMKRYKNPFKLYPADRPSMRIILIGSVIGPYLGISLSFIALSHTNVGVASTLLSTVPIIMLPLSYFFYKEKPSFKAIVGAVIAFCGVALLFL